MIERHIDAAGLQRGLRPRCFTYTEHALRRPGLRKLLRHGRRDQKALSGCGKQRRQFVSIFIERLLCDKALLDGNAGFGSVAAQAQTF